MSQSIGILGGTFDPVHNGHMAIAESALSQLGLDLLLFIPNARSPLKQAGPTALLQDRVAMLRLAIDGNDDYEVSEIEGQRGGTSYTIDTLRQLKPLYPNAMFYLIVGGDALRDFHLWREYVEIRRIARLAYVERRGTPAATSDSDAVRIDMPPVDVSSTMIRDLVSQGMPIDTLVPHVVAEYIATRHLYAPRN